MVILVNCGDDPFTIRRGDRIAQLDLPIIKVTLTPAKALTVTGRGSQGIGSTGGRRAR